MQEFVEVFPEELSSLPTEQEIFFEIDLLPERKGCSSAIFYNNIHCQYDLWSCNRNIQHLQICFSQDDMSSQCVRHALCVEVEDAFYNSFESQCETYNYNENVQYFQVQCVIQHAYDCCVQCIYKHIWVVHSQYESFLFVL